MNTLLISTAPSDSTAVHKSTVAHARSERDTESDQTPAFADVFVSQIAPESRRSATPPQVSSKPVHSGGGRGRNHDAPQDQPIAVRTHGAHARHHALAPALRSALTATEQSAGADTIAQSHHYSNGGLVAADDTEATGTLPNRFSQIIAALPKVSNDADGKDINRSLAAERLRSAQSDISAGKQGPDPTNAHQTHRSTWQHQSRMTPPGAVVSLNDASIPDKGASRAATLNSETVAFEKFLSQDATPALRELPAVQTMLSAPEAAAHSGLIPVGAINAGLTAALEADVSFNTATIDRPLHNPHWGAEFGRQFASLIRPGENGSQVAELRLDPPELGPLRVTININDSVVQAMFTSSHAAVRNAIEQALPQLQQQLEQEGLSLGQTSVDQNDNASQAGFDTAAPGTRTATGSNADASDETHAVPTRPRAPEGLIDTFA